MVAMNPQTWDKDVAEIEPGGYLFYDFDPAAAAVEVPRRHHRPRHAADRDLQRSATPTRASASCSRTSSMSARSPACSASSRPSIEKLIGRAVQGQGQADPAEHRGPAHGPRLRRASTSPAACGLQVRRADARRRPHLRRRQRRRGAGLRLRRRHGLPPGTRSRPRPRWPRPSPATAAATAPIRRPARAATPSSRPRTSSPRSAWSIGAAWNGARAFTATSGPASR